MAAASAYPRHQQQLPSDWTPSRTVVTSYTPHKRRQQNPRQNKNGGDSILAMQVERTNWSQPAATAAAALSNGTVHIYAVDSMRQLTEFRPHPDNNSTSFRAMHRTHTDSMVTAWGDGSVLGTDLRCASRSRVLFRTAVPTTAFASSSSARDDHHASLLWTGDAAGSVHCWDPRHCHRPVWQQEQRHAAGAVTQIVCSSSRTTGSNNDTRLLTGGSDGRVVLGTTTPDATSVVQLSAPVRRLGISCRKQVYCISDDEALHEWSCDNTPVVVRTTPLHHWQNRLRTTSTHVSYLIDCRYDDSADDGALHIAMGNHNGELAIATTTTPGDNNNSSSSSASSVINTAISTGHTAGRIVAWEPLLPSSCCWTAGTDARLCEWKRRPSLCGGDETTTTTTHRTMLASSKRQRRDSPTSTTLLPMVLG